MANGTLSFDSGVGTVNINVNWLNGNHELPVCLAQPQLVTQEVIAHDESRPQSLALAQSIFGNEHGQAQLGRWFQGENGLLLFPEYAFGSPDFESLDQLVREYAHPLIVIAGFGAVRGNSLRALLQSCEACWTDGANAVDEQSRYNAGWCWIHYGPGNTRPYIFLKNFFEQRLEITIPGITQGTHILELISRDLIVYPNVRRLLEGGALFARCFVSLRHSIRVLRAMPLLTGSSPKSVRARCAGSHESGNTNSTTRFR